MAYLDQEASALYQQGDEFGDNPALANAIDRYRALLKRRTRERVPLRLGRRPRTTSATRFGGSASGRAAPSGWRRRSKPIARRCRSGPASGCRCDWAMTQNNLGNALSRLGERESGTERLEEAVAAYRAALQERTRERVPLHWAMTQNNLGNALWRLGERESGTARLEEAVDAYRAALQERTRERVPLDWAMTQNNLGNALSSARRAGERHRSGWRRRSTPIARRCRSGPASGCRCSGRRRRTTSATRFRGSASGRAAPQRLEEAVAAYRAALQEQTRERVPLDWATTQNNLGNALSSARRAGERHRAAGGGGRRLSRGAAGADPRAGAAATGP